MLTTLVVTVSFLALLCLILIPGAFITGGAPIGTDVSKARWIYFIFCVPCAAGVNALILYMAYYRVVRKIFYRLEYNAKLAGEHAIGTYNPTPAPSAAGSPDPSVRPASTSNQSFVDLTCVAPPTTTSGFGVVRSNTETPPHATSSPMLKWLRDARRRFVLRHVDPADIDVELSELRCVLADMRPIARTLLEFALKHQRLDESHFDRFIKPIINNRLEMTNASFHSARSIHRRRISPNRNPIAAREPIALAHTTPDPASNTPSLDQTTTPPLRYTHPSKFPTSSTDPFEGSFIDGKPVPSAPGGKPMSPLKVPEPLGATKHVRVISMDPNHPYYQERRAAELAKVERQPAAPPPQPAPLAPDSSGDMNPPLVSVTRMQSMAIDE